MSALSVKAVVGFVLTARRGRTVVDVSFAAVLDFVRRGKLGLSAFDDWRVFRGRFVAGCCASGAELVVRLGIASELYALATARARTVLGERIQSFYQSNEATRLHERKTRAEHRQRHHAQTLRVE